MTTLSEVSCTHADIELKGLIALPDTPGPHPGVLIFHDALGIRSLVQQRARQLATKGYVALVADMYGEGARDISQEQAGAHLGKFHQEPEYLRERLQTWLATLQAREDVDAGRIAAFGYCFGGQCSLELARSGADINAVISFHGLLATPLPAQAGQVKAHVAVYTGEKDPYAPMEHVNDFREEMAAADADWQLTVFGGVYHGFTDADIADEADVPGVKYDRLADAVSWAGTEALLAEKLQ